MEDNKIDTGGFAFPLTDGKNFAQDGMTLRDYFAAQAMQGMLANPEILHMGNPSELMQVITTASYEHADSMIKERNKTK